MPNHNLKLGARTLVFAKTRKRSICVASSLKKVGCVRRLHIESLLLSELVLMPHHVLLLADTIRDLHRVKHVLRNCVMLCMKIQISIGGNDKLRPRDTLTGLKWPPAPAKLEDDAAQRTAGRLVIYRRHISK